MSNLSSVDVTTLIIGLPVQRACYPHAVYFYILVRIYVNVFILWAVDKLIENDCSNISLAYKI